MIKQALTGIVVMACVLSFAKTDWAGVSNEHQFLLPQYQMVQYQPHVEIEADVTAYWYKDPIDASGTGLAYDGNPAIPYKTIAVDPKVIPLGSKVYVPHIGWCLAHDTGSAIKGNRIDVAMDSKENALRWGRRRLLVKVIRPDANHKYKMEILSVEDLKMNVLSTNCP